MQRTIVLLCLVSVVLGFNLERTLNSNGRIVGGINTDISKYPYQVSVQLEGTHWCGGSLISENYVLTAAHCFTYLEYGYFYNVRVGSSIRSEFGVEYEVANFIIHEMYGKIGNVNAYDYDIALLRMELAIPFSVSAQPVSLPSKGEEVAEGTPAVVTGWGDLEESGESATVLQEVQVPIISNTDCSNTYSGITERMICAGFTSGGRDACQGDSGGPLVANGKQVGIVSNGYGCARPSYPGVYTRVATLRDWILRNSGI